MHPTITIVIATFNSAKTLQSVLESVKNQTFPKDKIEILIIDGGSTDETLNISRHYSCKIIHNPKVEPISAKILGYKHAHGNYILYLDADEVIENPKSLFLKYSAFKENAKIKAAIGSGYKSPVNSSFLTNYINEFGDPFSFFIYRQSKNSKYYLSELKKSFNILSENSTYVVFDFSQKGGDLLLELGAANTMIDLKYLRQKFPDFNSEIFAHLFQLLIYEKNLIAFVKNDPIIHYSTTNLSSYINKIVWRIKNNIFHLSKMGIAGFTGRQEYHSGILKLKKYLFIPYSLSVILPLIDAILLALSRKKISYLFHFPLTILSAYLILWYYLLKLAGFKIQLRNYDESKKI